MRNPFGFGLTGNGWGISLSYLFPQLNQFDPDDYTDDVSSCGEITLNIQARGPDGDILRTGASAPYVNLNCQERMLSLIPDTHEVIEVSGVGTQAVAILAAEDGEVLHRGSVPFLRKEDYTNWDNDVPTIATSYFNLNKPAHDFYIEVSSFYSNYRYYDNETAKANGIISQGNVTINLDPAVKVRNLADLEFLFATAGFTYEFLPFPITVSIENHPFYDWLNGESGVVVTDQPYSITSIENSTLNTITVDVDTPSPSDTDLDVNITVFDGDPPVLLDLTRAEVVDHLYDTIFDFPVAPVVTINFSLGGTAREVKIVADRIGYSEPTNIIFNDYDEMIKLLQHRCWDFKYSLRRNFMPTEEQWNGYMPGDSGDFN